MIVIAVVFQCTFNTIIQAQSYIGQTKCTIKKRFKNSLNGRSACYIFVAALHVYGAKMWNLRIRNYDRKMLTNMEDHYISSEQTLHPEIHIKYYGVGFMNQYKRLHLQHHHHHLSFMMLKQNE